MPLSTFVPAAGSWLMTDPAGTVVLVACVTVPSLRPAPASAVSASAWVRLLRSGTVACGLPVLTQYDDRVAALDVRAGRRVLLEHLAVGHRVRLARVLLADQVVLASSQSSTSVVGPASRSRPSVTVSLPLLTQMSTVAPSRSLVPPAGAWRLTKPCGDAVGELLLHAGLEAVLLAAP